MGLSEYRLGDLIELNDTRNIDEKFALDDVRGISIQKIFIETKADMTEVSLKPYILVRPDAFAYVTVTSRNGGKITIAHNNSDKIYIVSSSYVVFSVNRPDILLSDYLFMYFNRPEFDRYARFNSWGSARETFSWEDMCDITITLPPLSIQQKYVRIYNALRENLRVYERGLEDLKMVCDGFIEDLRRKIPCEKIGGYIELVYDRNESLRYGIDDVQGISIEKKFIATVADMREVDLRPYYIVHKNEFAFVPVTSRNGGKISLAMNDTDNNIICSQSYVVFRSKEKEKLLPEYLMLFLSRSEFDRYARFHSWGSARENFSFEDMCDVSIPIPDLATQESIANIYKVYQKRKSLSEKLKSLIKSICPVLIKGALEEAQKES